ncbi:BQ5605_C001g00862 [Microbotryum silenes-dioicae]|uniref:BQ5605_C001g00862 protein n=1 Tax=Microbotryum silenes-dioicae TaxID=796604 RepID=A0A2X0MRZ7_9BASI|nr:BQ5605_C001g00862 [Microbotryum silenes-dioicae]
MTASIASAGSKRAEPMDKNMTAHNECAKHADAALALSEERVTVTAEDVRPTERVQRCLFAAVLNRNYDDEQSRRICRKTDIHILLFLSWGKREGEIFSDKIIVGLSAVFGLRKQVGLVGNQYSNIGNIGYYAQLVMQPLAAYLLVKVPLRRFVPLIIFLWSVSLAGMAASKTYRAMLATRFFLGVFEAAVLPAFMMITSAFYRRSEQPVRVAIWYGLNGLATMVSSAVVYGIGHIRSSAL